MELSRRGFLKSAAIGGGTILAAGELLSFLTQASERQPAPPGPRQERWVLGVCGLCSCGCGLLARMIGERVVRLRGSPFHPYNRGGLCPRGCAGAQLLYHPHRLLEPLRRVGMRGDGRFEPVTWERALGELTARLGAGASVTVVSAATASQVGNLRRAVLPGATFLEHRPYYEPASPDPALFMTQGIWGHAAYDLESCDHILSFGSGLLERFWHAGEALHVYGQARSKGKCRLVHIESRRSVTGAKADQWVPIRPGTEATLALGIAHVIIKEGLLDREFVESQTFGYDDWEDEAHHKHEGFRALALRGFDPRTVSDVTSVPIEVLIKLARDFAAAHQSIAIGCDQPGVQGPHTRMAIHCLNALVGSIEARGGVLVPNIPMANPFPSAQAAATETVRGAVLSGPAGPSAETLLALRGKRGGVLLLSDVDVVGEALDRERVKAAVASSDFVVAMSTFRDSTVDQADLVLPLATYLERFMDRWDHTSAGFPLLAVAEPVVKPLGQSRAEGEIWLELSRRLGGKLPWRAYPDAVKAGAQKIYEFRRGELFSLENQETWLQVLEQSGWQPPATTDFESFWSGALKVGGWWDPVYYHQEWQRALKTPSGKFEFHSQSLARLLPGAQDLALRPHQEPVAPGSHGFSLALELFTPPTVGGLAGRLSWLRSLAGGHVNIEWNTWVELNPETASELKLPKGAVATVRSERGSIEAVVVHNPATPPGTAAIPCGLLPTDTDLRPGADPLVLLKPETEPLTGHQTRRTGRVSIELARVQ